MGPLYRTTAQARKEAPRVSPGRAALGPLRSRPGVGEERSRAAGMADGRELSWDSRPGRTLIGRSPRAWSRATGMAIAGPRMLYTAVQRAQVGTDRLGGLGRLEGLPAAAGWAPGPRYGKARGGRPLAVRVARVRQISLAVRPAGRIIGGRIAFRGVATGPRPVLFRKRFPELISGRKVAKLTYWAQSSSRCGRGSV
jgi:hypothetical protein